VIAHRPTQRDGRSPQICFCSRGQASIELLGTLPLLLVVALGAAQLLAAGLCREYAAQSARAGAVALLQGRDPREAAREAVPGWSHRGVEVAIEGRRVTVRVRPRAALPGLAGVLTAESAADAGPVA
jgi:hypothetical protein